MTDTGGGDATVWLTDGASRGVAKLYQHGRCETYMIPACPLDPRTRGWFFSCYGWALS